MQFNSERFKRIYNWKSLCAENKSTCMEMYPLSMIMILSLSKTDKMYLNSILTILLLSKNEKLMQMLFDLSNKKLRYGGMNENEFIHSKKYWYGCSQMPYGSSINEPLSLGH